MQVISNLMLTKWVDICKNVLAFKICSVVQQKKCTCPQVKMTNKMSQNQVLSITLQQPPYCLCTRFFYLEKLSLLLFVSHYGSNQILRNIQRHQMFI